MDHRSVGCLISADRIVLNRLVRTVLHKRYMLMCCSMIDQLRSVFLKDTEHSAAVADRSDQSHQIEVGILLPQFHLNVVSVILIDIQDDKLSGRMSCDLPAELTADGAAASGDQHCFAIDEVEDFFHICLNGLTAEKIFYRHLFHLADCHFTAHELIHAGQVLEFTVSLFADVQDISALLSCGAGYSQIDLLDLELLYVLQNAVSSTHDRYSVDVASPLVGFVIDEAHDPVFYLPRSADVTRNRLSRIAGADDHDTSVGSRVSPTAAEQQYKAIREADHGHEDELQCRSHYIIGNRHALEEKRNKQSVEHRSNDCRHYDIQKLCIAGIFPDTLVESCSPEHKEAEYGVNRCEMCPCLKVSRVDCGELQVESKPQSRNIREIDDRQIIQDQ